MCIHFNYPIPTNNGSLPYNPHVSYPYLSIHYQHYMNYYFKIGVF